MSLHDQGHRIMLRSQPGRGTGFELLLPAARSLPEAPAPEQAAADRLAGRALVVDDDLPARSALALSLRHWGLVCDEAANAQQALAWAHGHVYDVVLCDHGLPGGVDGSALLAQLQALQPGTRLWAILSAASPPSPPAEGAPLWLTKPLRPVRLRALLQGALQAPAD